MWRIIIFLSLTHLTFAGQAPRATPEDQVNHLFNRLTFGPRPGEVEKLLRSGSSVDRLLKKWIEIQMHPDSIDDQALDQRLVKFESLRLTSNQMIERYPTPRDYAQKILHMDAKVFEASDALKREVRAKIGEAHLPERIVEELDAAKVIRAVESRRQFQEVLTDFWFNHFNVDLSKGETKWYVTSYERDVIRKNVFSNFRQMLGAVAHSPAMLFYLDNFLSVSESPMANGKRPDPNRGLNENYGRELLELHTLGVDGGYRQDDVREVARALTGWSIDDAKRDAVFKFKEKLHDPLEKLILGKKFVGKGEDEGERVLDFLANHPSTAHFVALKLCRHFVSDQPSNQLVNRVAKVFLKTHGDFRSIYRAIVWSREFWDKKFFNSKIKTPFQYVVSSIRVLGGEVELKSDVPRTLQQMGQPLFRCAPPTGYKDSSEDWVNPGALVARLNFGLGLAANRVTGIFVQLPHFDPVPTMPKLLVGGLSEKLLHRAMSSASEKVVLKEFNSEGRVMANGEIRPLSLAQATGLILGSPEFQRK